MWIHQALLFFTALSLHSGFGLALGILIKWAMNTRKAVLPLLLSAGFFVLVYLPSCLAISGLHELAVIVRSLIILFSSIAIIFPIARAQMDQQLRTASKVWGINLAVSMLLLTALSFVSFYFNDLLSGAPLAVSSAVAGIAAIHRQYKLA